MGITFLAGTMSVCFQIHRNRPIDVADMLNSLEDLREKSVAIETLKFVTFRETLVDRIHKYQKYGREDVATAFLF